MPVSTKLWSGKVPSAQEWNRGAWQEERSTAEYPLVKILSRDVGDTVSGFCSELGIAGT